jgi:O-antigen ligase
MVIKWFDYLTEFFLFVLAVGMTVNNAPCEVASYLIIFIFLLKHIIRRDIKLPSSPINMFLCIYFVVALVTVTRSSYLGESLKGFSRVPKYIFLYFALLEFFKNDIRRQRRFFWMLMIVAVVTFINGIFQSIFGFDFFRHNLIAQPESLRRISSSFCHPNDFGSYIISVLPLTFLFFSSLISRQKRLILSVISFLGFYCLLKTSSRSAWLGFLAAVIIYFFIYKKKVALLIPIFLLVAIMVLPHGLERLNGLFKPEQNTVWERTKLWQGAWNMIKERPLLGFGVNTFSRNFPKYKPVDYPDLRYAHNSYLQMWSEIGVIGLFTFLAMPLIVLINAFKGIKNKINAATEGLIFLGALCGYIAFLLQGSMDNNLFSLVLTTLFWVFTAYIVSWDDCLGKKSYAER